MVLRVAQDTASAVCAFRLRNLAKRADVSVMRIKRNGMKKVIASGNTPRAIALGVGSEQENKKRELPRGYRSGEFATRGKA